MTDWGDVDEELAEQPSTIAALLELVEVQRDTVIAISTGTAIASHKSAYRRRRSLLRSAFRQRGLADPFIWPDLDTAWAWAKQWSTYAERRAEVAKLITPLVDQLDDLQRSGKVDDWGGGPDEWSNVESRLSGLRDEMDHATTLDHFQDVGRRGREVIIDVVNLVLGEDMVTKGDDVPKAADAKGRFDAIVQTYAPGSSHAELRKLMRAAWDLSQKVTHGDITRVDAFASAQATVLIVRTLAEMQREGLPISPDV